jgi:NitT/TauT family transport system permease protein
MQPRILAIGVLILGVFAVVWEVLVDALNVAPFLLPPPSAIMQELASRFPLYLQQSGATLLASVLGFLVAAIAGVVLGTMIVYSWVLRGVLYPVILVLQVVPKVALAPLFIVWIGYGLHSRVLVAAVIAFFPVVMNTVVGLSSVERELLDLVRMLRGSRMQQFVKIAFPHAMPFIFSGLKVAVTFAVIGEIVAEFISGNEGLGYLILVANSEMNVAMSFAALILLSVMGLALFGIMELLERICVSWNREEADQAFAAVP